MLKFTSIVGYTSCGPTYIESFLTIFGQCINVLNYKYACMYVYMYVCTYVRMYVCTYVRMYVCTYVTCSFDFRDLRWNKRS